MAGNYRNTGFQFLKGAIKSLERERVFKGYKVFQFLKGAIKSWQADVATSTNHVSIP